MANLQIPPARRGLYYFGMVISLGGLISFLSVFVTAALNFGEFDDFRNQARSEALRGACGMIAMIVGGAIMGVAAKGLAGSGLVLNPQQARSDLEPWSRLSGGVAGDALDEAGLPLNKLSASLSDLAGAAQLPFDEKLRRLHDLRRDGILTEEEYRRQKQKLLDES